MPGSRGMPNLCERQRTWARIQEMLVPALCTTVRVTTAVAPNWIVATAPMPVLIREEECVSRNGVDKNFARFGRLLSESSTRRDNSRFASQRDSLNRKPEWDRRISSLRYREIRSSQRSLVASMKCRLNSRAIALEGKGDTPLKLRCSDSVLNRCPACSPFHLFSAVFSPLEEVTRAKG